jgi:Family of unknown function (DUF6064)
MLPFTREQFTAVFADYNAAVWPAQVVGYLVGVAIIGMLVRPSKAGNRVIGAGLAAMWIWTGVAYHGLHFSAINQAAWAFGALFVVQGVLLLQAVVIAGRPTFGQSNGMAKWLGWVFVIYASIVYPLMGIWTGHRYPEMPMFGITPCPVTIFTFGVLLLSTTPVPRRLLAIPLLWSLIGGSAAFLLGVPQDWLLLFSGVVTVLVLRFDRVRWATAGAA